MAEQPPLMPIRRPRGPSPQQVRRRRIVALVAIVLAVGVADRRRDRRAAACPHDEGASPPPPPAPKPFRVIFPEGFTRAQMIERVGVVAKIAARKKHHAVALNSRTYALATRARQDPVLHAAAARGTSRDSSFPATYDFLATTTSRELAADQLETFCKNWNQVNLAYAKSKNLTPYDVLIIASMVEKETLAPDERPKVAAVIYNRLHEHMPLGIDATLRYGLHIPPTQSILQSQLDSNNPYNSRRLHGLAADADREPRARLDPGGGASGQGRLPLLRAQARQGAPLLHRERHRVRAVRVRARLRLLRCSHVALLGHPVSASLSPRMQNAAFAARGLDWHYAAFDVVDVVEAVRALRALGFAGANVTVPHKQAVVEACDEADGAAVNTLVFRDGSVIGHNTDREILAGIDARCACVIGEGGAARALAPALPARHPFVLAPRGRGRRTRPIAT